MPLSFVSLKAFGDFVIACHALRRVRHDVSERPGIVAASHLRALADAIGFADVRFVAGDEDEQVPAAFDIRRRGLRAAARSLITLRRRLATLPAHGQYVFDHLGWRERLLASKPSRIALPAAANIYLAYERLLAGRFRLEAAPCSALASTGRIQSAVIVPASRIAAKTIPASAIAGVGRALRAQGIDVEIALLEGDRVDVPDGFARRNVARNFPSLIDVVRTSDVVISADSLAAHLAELYGTRCFVVGPRPNPYWLPASCWSSQAWCLFDDVAPLEHALRSWLAGDVCRPPRDASPHSVPL